MVEGHLINRNLLRYYNQEHMSREERGRERGREPRGRVAGLKERGKGRKDRDYIIAKNSSPFSG